MISATVIAASRAWSGIPAALPISTVAKIHAAIPKGLKGNKER
jgi:hypothetical protein